MSHPTLHPEIEESVRLAVFEAARRRHELAGLEHLLLGLIGNDTTAAGLRQCGTDVGKLTRLLVRYLDSEIEPLPGDLAADPTPTLAFQRVLQEAVFQVVRAGRSEVTALHVVAALWGEPDAFAVHFLEDAGLTRLSLLRYLSHGSRSDAGEISPAGEPPPDTLEEDDADRGGAPGALERFAVSLSRQAEEGRLDPVIGRQAELARAIQVLSRRRKNNPVFIGEPGVGKTAIVEGLAERIHRGEVPRALRKAEVFALDLGALLAGTRYRGDFEERLRDVISELKARPGAILFIDEIHTVVGAGSTQGGSMDASNLLKPALANGEIRCIGASTWEEFRAFEKDRALSRRFQPIEVLEPSVEETIEILEGVRSHYEAHHGVRYTDGALRGAAELTDRWMHERRLPDKAIDLLDEAGAAARLADEDAEEVIVDVDEIERTVAAVARIPVATATLDDRERLRTLEPELKARVFGQDAAIERLTAAIRLARSGLREGERPVGSFLLTGPTGVGKTEVARSLAAVLGIELIRFDMSEYTEPHTVARLIGAPPGYVGFDQPGLLTDAVNRAPHAVLLLDEIEKAHPDVYDLLLQVMDYGKLTDHNGRKVDFRNVIVIMTSNVGAEEASRTRAGFASVAWEDDERHWKEVFSPEFRNRLDARIPFAPLTLEIMERIVERSLEELHSSLAARNVRMTNTPAARRWLADRALDPLNGARPLSRLVQDRIRAPVGDEILFGTLRNGGSVHIHVADGELNLSFETNDPAS